MPTDTEHGDAYDPTDHDEHAERFKLSAAHGHGGQYASPATFVAWTNELASFQCPDCGARFTIEWLTWAI